MWNVPPRKILIATDFSDASAKAARIAGDLARALGASVTAVHAESFEAPPYFTHEQVETIEHQRRNARRAAAHYLANTVGQLAGVPVDPIISDRPAVEAILQASVNYDLVVMGTHGRRGPARWWAGSVAERVARHAPVPVLVVRADTASAAALFQDVRVLAAAGETDAPVRDYVEGLEAPFKSSGPTGSVPTLTVVTQLAHVSLAPVLIVPGRPV